MFKYLTLYNFKNEKPDHIWWSTELSLYELSENEINEIVDDYKIRIKIDNELYEKLEKLHRGDSNE